MKILTVIVTYNFERWMERCLCSLRISSLPTDVLVVDNASTDNTIRRIERDFPEVRLIKRRDNLGFGKANNIGLKIACDEGYDAVYLLNQDAWLFPDTLEKLSSLSERHAEYGILSPVHLDGTEEKLDHGFADYAKKKSVNDVKSLEHEGKEVIDVSFVNAAHWFIPIKVLKQVGGFSPLFFMYGEDLDWTNRLKHHGYRIGYAPSAFAVHDRSKVETTKEKVGRINYVYLLSEYANINRSFSSAFAYSVLASVKSTALSLAKQRWSDAWMYMKILFKLSLQTMAVIRARHTVSAQAAPYLGK